LELTLVFVSSTTLLPVLWPEHYPQSINQAAVDMALPKRIIKETERLMAEP
jgi:hypothetical protein